MRSIPTLAVTAIVFACLVGLAVAKGKGGGGGKGLGGGKSFSGHAPNAGGHAAQKPAKHEPGRPSAHTAKDKSPKELGPPVQQPGGAAANKKEQQLQLFQQQRDKKLAQAEHLRGIAERNGNANLAANADRMEAQALQQYADKVAHLEKFGVTDPELNPQLPVDENLAH